jgi:hypothetical protein
MDPIRMSRLWLFFALLAVGLVWTWSQVAQQPLEHSQVGAEDVVLLRTEPGCDLAQGPCAAYGNDVALVASVRAAGEGVAWRVKLVGAAPALPQLSLWLLSPGTATRELAVFESGDEWYADSARRVPPNSLLRVRVSGGPVPLIADFPLQGKR